MTSHCVPVFDTFYQSIYCTNCKINCMPVKPVWKGWIMLYIIELDGKCSPETQLMVKTHGFPVAIFPQTNPMITSSRILTTLWRWHPHRPRQLHMVDIADESGALTSRRFPGNRHLGEAFTASPSHHHFYGYTIRPSKMGLVYDPLLINHMKLVVMVIHDDWMRGTPMTIPQP